MRARTSRICLLVCLFALPNSAAVAATYYVSPSGDDANPGTSSQPWRSLQQASSVVQPGDVVLIDDGDYPGGIDHTTSGTSFAPIVFQAINPGGPVVWGDQTPDTDAFHLDHSDWVIIDGLSVRNANRAGIRVDNANNCTVRHCTIIGCQEHGIFTNYSDDTTLEYNECAFSTNQHGIYVSNSGDRPIVRFNICHDNPHAGIQFNGDGKQTKPELGTRGDGIIQDGQLVGNIIYNNGLTDAAAGLNLLCTCSTLVANNLLYNNQAGGIALGNDNLQTATQWGSKNNRILNNTIYFRSTVGRWCISATNGSTGNVIRNNILFGGAKGAFQFDDSSLPFVSDYNLMPTMGAGDEAVNDDTQTFYNLDEWRALTGNDMHSSMADPLFVSESALPFDFHVQPGSPAIGAGVATTDVVSDLDGNTRPSSGAVDLGCYQSNSPAPSTYVVVGTVTFNGTPLGAVEIAAGSVRAASAADGTYTLAGLAPGTYKISANHPDYLLSAAQSVTIGPSKTGVNFTATSNLIGISFSPARVQGTVSSTGKVTLSRAAPPGGTLISLTSSDPTASVPASVLVAAGTTTATFAVTTASVTADMPVTIGATLGLGSVAGTLVVVPAGVSSLSVAPTAVAGGTNATGTIKLTGAAPEGGSTVSLQTDSSTASVPVTVTIPAGSDTATFPISTQVVAADKPVTVSASLGTSSASAVLTVSKAGLQAVSLDPSSVVGGGTSKCTVTLSGPAPAGGLVVKLASSSGAVASVPSSVTVPGGATSATVTVTTTSVGANTNVTLTATLGTKAAAATLTVQAPGLQSVSVTPNVLSAGAAAIGTVTLASPAGGKSVSVNIDVRFASGDGNGGDGNGDHGDPHSYVKFTNKVTVKPGTASANFAVAAQKRKTHNPLTFTVYATANGVTKTTTLTIQ